MSHTLDRIYVDHDYPQYRPEYEECPEHGVRLRNGRCHVCDSPFSDMDYNYID